LKEKKKIEALGEPQLLYPVATSGIDPTLNGHLKYPNNLDQSLNDAAADKIRKYRADYNNRPPSPVSFMSSMARQTRFIVNLSDFYSYRLIEKLTAFL
jgi:hypothetical protein